MQKLLSVETYNPKCGILYSGKDKNNNPVIFMFDGLSNDKYYVLFEIDELLNFKYISKECSLHNMYTKINQNYNGYFEITSIQAK